MLVAPFACAHAFLRCPCPDSPSYLVLEVRLQEEMSINGLCHRPRLARAAGPRQAGVGDGCSCKRGAADKNPVSSNATNAARLLAGMARATASQGRIMTHLWAELRHNPLLWLLVFVPAVFGAHARRPETAPLLFKELYDQA